MLDIDDRSTVPRVFRQACDRWPEQAFVAVPGNTARDYHPDGLELTYSQAGAEVDRLALAYRDAGYGLGHRVALLLDNRPDHLLHKLALAQIGACCVPINPDHRAAEIAYVADHARVDTVVVLARRAEQLAAGLALASHRPQVVVLEALETGLTAARRPADPGPVQPTTPLSILYTSGTTGRPKGCVLSHHYELASGHWYATRGGVVAIRVAQERLYNPLPLYHVNASVVSFYAMLVTGNCQIQSDRFQPIRWWPEIAATRATIVHYLGVIAPMLLAQPAGPQDRDHRVRIGVGAGIEPTLHAAFERRFGFPMIELWGMTEMVRVLIDNHAPRQVGTRAFGRPSPGLDVKVIDDGDREVPDDQPGEMLVRHSAAEPRKGAFSGYLDDPEATEHAWRGGWFHTGDTVRRATDGMLHFVDRKKNIIRRSGENIAAAEVEALLQSHDDVVQVAVLAVPDAVREEEVFAAVVVRNGKAADAALARTLFDWCDQRLAYFKAPGWIWFTDSLPTTGTQKIQKHQIFAAGVDPCRLPAVHDLRALKKRSRPGPRTSAPG